MFSISSLSAPFIYSVLSSSYSIKIRMVSSKIAYRCVKANENRWGWTSSEETSIQPYPLGLKSSCQNLDLPVETLQIASSFFKSSDGCLVISFDIWLTFCIVQIYMLKNFLKRIQAQKNLNQNKLIIYEVLTIFSMTFNQLGQYLAGLIEGDGSIRKDGIKIQFAIKDYELAKSICIRFHLNYKKLLKRQFIEKRKANYYTLQIPKSQVKNVLNCVNGHFVTRKRVDQLKDKDRNYVLGKHFSKPILLASHKNFTDLWITGFFDADGSISLLVKRGHCVISISQSLLDGQLETEYPEVLELLAKKFGLNIAPANRKKARKNANLEFQVRTEGTEKLKLFFDHFSRNPPQGIKKAQVHLAKKAFNIFLEKKHLTPEGQKKFQKIYKAMQKVKLKKEMKTKDGAYKFIYIL